MTVVYRNCDVCEKPIPDEADAFIHEDGGDICANCTVALLRRERDIAQARVVLDAANHQGAVEAERKRIADYVRSRGADGWDPSVEAALRQVAHEIDRFEGTIVDRHRPYRPRVADTIDLERYSIIACAECRYSGSTVGNASFLRVGATCHACGVGVYVEFVPRSPSCGYFTKLCAIFTRNT